MVRPCVEWPGDSHNNTDESQNSYVEWNSEKLKLIYSDRKHNDYL